MLLDGPREEPVAGRSGAKAVKDVFEVRFFDDEGWLCFAQPWTVHRAYCVGDALCALAEAEAALNSGSWIAGCLSYELGSAFVNEPHRCPSAPLLTLGFFDEPARTPPVGKGWAISPLMPRVSFASYGHAFAAIAQRLADGDVYQVNLTIPFDLALEGDLVSAWADIARTTRAHYQAYVRDGERHVLSWSPELFLEFDGTQLRTRPMKGTAHLEHVDALHDRKNSAEHVMIVDLLRNDLQRVCDGVRLEAFQTVERYATFATMTSTIAGRLRRETTLRDVFSATFPCASITGAPKRAAFASIAELEDEPRVAYCGSIGFLSPARRGWWNVAIRTAQFEGELGRFDAGGGIVSDSRPADEWGEIQLKTAFLARPFELWETIRADAASDVLEAHLARLHGSAERFGIDYDEPAVRAAIAANAAPNTLLRIRLSSAGSFVVLAEAIETPRDICVLLTDVRVDSKDPFLRIKSSWRPKHRTARLLADARGCFDALLRNERDELTEGTRTSVFCQINDELLTPPLSSGLLPSVLRERMLAQGHAQERVIRVADLEQVSALFVGNSARGLLAARMLT